MLISKEVQIQYFNKCIEFDGKQHFEPSRFNGMTEEKAKEQFIDTLKKDKIKNTYCKEKNIELLRISYKDLKNVNIILNKELLNVDA